MRSLISLSVEEEYFQCYDSVRNKIGGISLFSLLKEIFQRQCPSIVNKVLRNMCARLCSQSPSINDELSFTWFSIEEIKRAPRAKNPADADIGSFSRRSLLILSSPPPLVPLRRERIPNRALPSCIKLRGVIYQGINQRTCWKLL